MAQKRPCLSSFNVFKTHRDRPRSARSLFRLSQELIAATQAENAEQACPSDFLTLREEVFLHEYSRDTLRGDDGGPPTEAPDPPPTDTDRSAKELCTSTDEYRFERDSFQQEFGKYPLLKLFCTGNQLPGTYLNTVEPSLSGHP